MDGLLKYSEFTSAFMPVNQHFARELGSKRLQYVDPPSSDSFNPVTMQKYAEVWHLMIQIEQQVEEIKQRLS